MQYDTDLQKEKLYQFLSKKYKKVVISKQEMANELGIKYSTISLYIKKGTGIPNYKKLGKSKNSKVVFNLKDVAEFLSDTIKTV